MIYTLTLRNRFAASHVLEDHHFCGKMHGHSYRVEVTIMGDPDPDTHNLVANEWEAWNRLHEVVGELKDRHLNDMLGPAVIPSVQGVANWFWERLSLHYRMYEVTVWQDDLAASIRRDR